VVSAPRRARHRRECAETLPHLWLLLLFSRAPRRVHFRARYRGGMAATDAAARMIALEGSFNFRDLGGYATNSGQLVAWKRLYRADGPHALSAADVAMLPELAIATVIDLRTVDEA